MKKKNIIELVTIIIIISVVMIYTNHEIKSKKLEKKCSDTARQGTANLIQAYKASNMEYNEEETYNDLYKLCIENNK